MLPTMRLAGAMLATGLLDACAVCYLQMLGDEEDEEDLLTVGSYEMRCTDPLLEWRTRGPSEVDAMVYSVD